MASWIESPDPDAAEIVDHVAKFRLDLARAAAPAAAEGAWWSVLVELTEISIDAFAGRLAAFADDLLIPAAYDAADRRAARPRQPLVLYARPPLIAHLNDRRADLGIETLRLGATTPERFLDRSARPGPLPEIVVADDAVVQAVVDDGIAIANALFRRGPTATRIAHARLFDAAPLPDGHASVGRALDAAQIDALLAECTFGGLLDEDLFYARSGQVDPARQVFSTVALRRSHGTHVMALAAGAPMEAARADRPVICAALPSRIVGDTTGTDLLPVLYLAFHVLVKQARRFRTRAGSLTPVVFNLSYGNTDGPHDGTGIFAELFDFYFGVRAAPVEEVQTAWLTLPAGNANLARLHAVAEAGAAEGRTRLDLAVLPDDRTPSQVQIWLPAGETDPDLLQVRVRSPGGRDRGQIEARPGAHAALVDAEGARIAWLAYQFVGGRTQRGLITLSINPTADSERATAPAPAGLWEVEIERCAAPDAPPIEIYVRRDETLRGQLPGGRQAFFDDPGYVRFDRFGAPLPVDPSGTACPVRRSGTLSGFATGGSPLVVAAYTAAEAVLSDYSAAGPLNPTPDAAPREGPDLAARGDDSVVRRGVVSAGSRSGSWVRMAGTSVAAPQIARLAARDIARHEGPARSWAALAVARAPFPLRDAPSRERVGAGAVKTRPDDL